MSENWEQMCVIYNQLECHKCLCAYNSKKCLLDLWHQMYQNSFKVKGIAKQEKSQLLCISLVRLTAEIYIDDVSSYQHVCQNIKNLLEIFLSEDLWNIFIHHLKCPNDKYLTWTFIKSLSVALYSSNEKTFSHYIKMLLNDIKDNIFEINNASVLDFLSSLVDFNIKSYESNVRKDSCKNTVSSTVCPIKDLFQNFCMILSEYWSIFMKQFYEIIISRCENQTLNTFLILWQKLIEKQIQNNLIQLFIDEECVAFFFSNAYYLPVISLRVYANIILQYFISSFIFKLRPEVNNSWLKEAVITAIDKDFFHLLPQNMQLTGFCVSTVQNNEYRSGCQKACKIDSVIVKKVTFIFFSALSSVRNYRLLLDGVKKVFDFVKENFDIPPNVPTRVWIFDIFIDQDDILIGVMHSLLKIYLILKEENIKECILPHLENDLNPHAIFIGFLQRIGFEYTELLVFLTTDEACFLLYLLQYLKLLIKEWENFTKTEKIIIKEDEIEDFNVVEKCKEECSEIKNVFPSKNSLVCYSSSSDEDTESVSENYKDSKRNYQNDSIVIRTLVKLKDAIQKLIHIDEFPYKALPLVALLQACEEHSLQT